jgi:hypothetical protein
MRVGIVRESRFLIISFAAIFLPCLLIRTAFGATWEKILGGDKTDIGYSVQQTTDGGYIIAGETYSFGVAVSDVYLIKTDATGEEVWSKTFGSTRYDRGKCVRQTTDGGYIVAGSMEPSGPGTDVYLIKTDANGDEIWSKTFGGGDYDYGESVQETADGGYVIAGYTQSFGAGNADVYLIKTDANGDEIWSKTFGGTELDAGHSVLQTGDGGYIIVGETRSFGKDDVYLIKTDANGVKVWDRFLGFGAGYSIQQTTDGGYIIAGVYPPNNYDVLLIKTDANGYAVWTKIIGGQWNDYAYSVQQTADGGYIVTGFIDSLGDGNFDVYLIKTDANGDEIWSKTFGGSVYDVGYSVIQTDNRGYIIVGRGSGGVYLIYYKPEDTVMPWIPLLLLGE